MHFLRVFCVCIFTLFLKATLSDVDSWSADVPNSVAGLVGSCVVIPCKYTYPGQPRTASALKGIWFRGTNEIVYHPEASKVVNVFQQRTSLVGELEHGNCSLMIKSLRHDDQGSFFFRIEIKDFNNYSYLGTTVSVALKDNLDPPTLSLGKGLRSGEVCNASCSVFYSCPFDPPLLTWSHIGLVSQSQQQNEGQWKMMSSLAFIPTRTDHKKPLLCTAVLGPRETVVSKKKLNVLYSPVNVTVVARQEVREGDWVELSCSSDSNPPAHRYQWHSLPGTLLADGGTYTLQSVSRHTAAVYCSAINALGSTSSIPLQLNVVYPPEIREGSSCNAGMPSVTCVCIVYSSPHSAIRWWLPDQARELSSTTLERHGSLTIATLQQSLGYSDSLQCYANNTQGNSTVTLKIPQNRMSPLVTVTVPVILVAVIGLSIWIVKKRCGRGTSEEAPHAMSCSPMEANTHTGSDSKIESDHSSQCIYSNMEADGQNEPYEIDHDSDDTAIYANM